MSFIYVADGIDDVLAAHLNQYADAWSGVAGKGQPFNAVAVNDPINFAISARNLDPTNSRAMQLLKADGTVLFQCDASGVKVSPDGTVASVPVTATATQTLTNKTFTAPVVDSGGLRVTAGNVGIGVAPVSYSAVLVQETLTGLTQQVGFNAQLTGDSSATAEVTGFYSQPKTAAAAFTSTTVAGFHALNPTKGAGSTITNTYGLLVDAITAGNINNYGVYINAPSGGTTNEGLHNEGLTRLNGGIGINIAAVASKISVATGFLPARVVGDVYLIWNPTTGEIHQSAVGPAS